MPQKDKMEIGRKCNGEAESGDYSKQSFEQAFELTGHGSFNRAVMLTCGLIHLNVCMETIGMSYVIPAAQCDLALTDQHKGLLSASGFIGIVSTSIIWGYMGDTFGRRAVMLPAMVISALLSAASAFAVNFYMMLVLRLFTGGLVSASSATVYAYLGEMHSAAHRSAAIAWCSVFLSFCFMLLPALAWMIVPGTWSVHIVGSLSLVPWRVFMLSWSVPCLAAIIALCSLPESPKFLLAKRGESAALCVLAKMYAINRKTDAQHFPVKQLVTSEQTLRPRQGLCDVISGTLRMFRPPLLRCVVVAHISMFCVFMLSSGMYMWVPDILNSLLTSNSQGSVCDIIRNSSHVVRLNSSSVHQLSECHAEISTSVFPISMAMGALFATAYLLIGFLINRIGKKKLFGTIMVVCGALTIGAGHLQYGIAGAGLLVLALCSGCCASILASITVDVFPTEIRAMAMCVMYMVGRSGAAVGSNVLGAMLTAHCETSFILFGIITAVPGLLVTLWPKPLKVREKMELEGFKF